MRKTLNIGWWMMAMALLMPATGCNRKQAQVAVTEAVTSQVAAPSSWAVHTARLGFIAHLPADTEACFGSLNLPAHTAAVKETNYFKELTAFLDDKTPAPAATGASTEKKIAKPKVFEKLMGDDFFISLGKGAAKSIQGWQQLSSVYSEMMYRGLMAGATPGAKAGSGEKEQMLGTLIKNPDMVKRVAALIKDVQLPPLMMGVRTDKPEEVLKELLPEDLLTQIKKKAKVSQVTTNLNGKFTLIEATGKDVFTDELKKQWLDSLPADAAASLPEINQAMAALQAKPFILAYGVADGYLIVSLGTTRPSLAFAADASSSVVSRPEFGGLAPYEGKNLVAVFFADGATLQSMQNPEPLQPIARGVLAGLKTSPMFSAMANKLEGKVAALAPLEHELYNRPMTTAIGAAWWDKGLHIEVEGGMSSKGLESAKPLKFASLVDDPNAVLAINYHGDPQFAATLRTYLEGWADVIHVAGQELAKANMFGEQGPKMATWIDQEVLPQVVSFYNGSKTLYGKALGNEHAWVMDLGGHMPALPGMAAPDPKAETKMVRIVGMYDVVDRKLIGSSWAQMDDSLNALTKAFPMLAGQKLPDPEVSNNSGVTCYSFPLPMLGSDDLLFCASVSDKVYMLGTSRTQQEEIAARLLRAPPGPGTPTMLWRLNTPKLREALKSFSPAVPAAPAAGDNLKTATKWMAPLGDLRGRMWIESGRVRNSISWEMKDTVKFD